MIDNGLLIAFIPARGGSKGLPPRPWSTLRRDCVAHLHPDDSWMPPGTGPASEGRRATSGNSP